VKVQTRVVEQPANVADGQKQTIHPRPKSIFACFGPKADKTERNWIVRLVPLVTNAPQHDRRK
jgi:hypothetical protein